MDMAAAISENVKRIRKSRGMTQKEFGEKAGVSHYTIISIEHGKTTSLSVLEQLANAYELSPADLLSPESVTHKPLLDAINVESVIEDDFNALPPFKQSFYKAVAVKLDKCYDEPLTEAYYRFKIDMLDKVDKGINLLNTENMTVIEVKQAAIKAAHDVILEHF